MAEPATEMMPPQRRGTRDPPLMGRQPVHGDQLPRLKRVESWLSLSGSVGFVVAMASAPTGWAQTGRVVLGLAGVCWVISAVLGLAGFYLRRTARAL
jgi:hypothetical protein